MAHARIDSAQPRIVVEPTRPRQTERPATPFREILAGGVGVLMSGAEVATSVVGGPLLAAAVGQARGEVVASVRGAATAEGGTPPSSAPDVASLHAMQRESQALNMQMLALQEEVARENRQFTTLSNVLRARHDTAKAAVANIRS